MNKGYFLALLVSIIVIYIIAIHKPSQPEKYQKYICLEAYEGAVDKCTSFIPSVSQSDCNEIAESAYHMCIGALPEENAK